MQTITLDEYVNGFGIRIYDTKKLDYLVNETQEERIEALKVVERWVRDQIVDELQRKAKYANIV